MAAVEMSIDLQSEALAAAFAKAPALAINELVAAAWESELLVQREVMERTPTGANQLLRQSISAQEPEVLADRVIGAVGTALSYAVPVELGTKPHMPPVQPLVDWAKAKLGLSQSEAQEVGFLIARKIAVKGTEGAHMFEKGLEATRPQVERILERAVARIVSQIGGQA